MKEGGLGEDSNLTQVHCISGSQITIDICCPGANHIFLDKSDSCSFSIFLLLSLIAMDCCGTLKKMFATYLMDVSPSAISPGSRVHLMPVPACKTQTKCIWNESDPGATAQWVQHTLCTAPLPPQLAAGVVNKLSWSFWNTIKVEAVYGPHLVQAPAQSRADFQVLWDYSGTSPAEAWLSPGK